MPSRKKATQPLTERQRRFVDEYMVDGNATQAAIRAGYAKRTAYRIGFENLRKPQIADAIAERQAERAERVQVDADAVLRELARIAFSDPRKLYDENGRLKNPHEWDDDTAAAIAGLETVTRQNGDDEIEYVHKVRRWDKVGALEKLAKHLGLYQEAMQVEGKLDVVLRKEY